MSHRHRTADRHLRGGGALVPDGRDGAFGLRPGVEVSRPPTRRRPGSSSRFPAECQNLTGRCIRRKKRKDRARLGPVASRMARNGPLQGRLQGRPGHCARRPVRPKHLVPARAGRGGQPPRRQTRRAYYSRSSASLCALCAVLGTQQRGPEAAALRGPSGLPAEKHRSLSAL